MRRSAGLALVPLAAALAASCSVLPSIGAPSPAGDAGRPVCAPRGADLGRAFADAGCRAGDVLLTSPPGTRQAAILAARVCDFSREVVIQRRDEATDVGAMLACVYAGRVRPVPE